MRSTIQSSWNSLRVGLLLIIAIAVALWASLSGGGTSVFEHKTEFIVYFANVNGLLDGSPVWMAGVEVGNVRSVKFVNLDSLRKVEVVGAIESDVWQMVTQGTQVQLGTIGILGDKYMEVIPGPIGAPVLPPKSVLPPKEAGSVDALLYQGTKALNEATSLVKSLDEFLTRANRGEGTLGRLATDDAIYVQMTDLLARLTKLTAALSANQERLTGSVEKTADAVGRLAGKVDSSTGTLGKLISDPAVYDNLAATSARLDTIMARISKAQGSLGLMVSDTALYIEAVNLLDRINNLVSDIEQNPRKYLKFSVF